MEGREKRGRKRGNKGGSRVEGDHVRVKEEGSYGKWAWEKEEDSNGPNEHNKTVSVVTLRL